MKWLKRVGAFLAAVLAGALALFALVFSRRSVGAMARQKRLEEAHARAAKEAAEKHGTIDERRKAELAAIEAKAIRDLKILETKTAKEREREKALIRAQYDELDDDETRARLLRLLDDVDDGTVH